MLPLHRDPWFTFRFADDRIIPRFHLEGIPPGSHVSVVKINPETGERLGLLATVNAGSEGWVDLPKPIVVRKALPLSCAQMCDGRWAGRNRGSHC